jgi:SAM-dependent methyltransferase
MSDRPLSPPVETPPAATDLLSPLDVAYREYNAALTRLDAAVQALGHWPDPPPPPDATQVPRLNDQWNILPGGAPALESGWRGRLGGFVWRLLGPALQRQLGFNAALVDHLNRNAEAQARAHRALADVAAQAREGFAGLVRFESLLLQYLQQITPLVDTRDRAVQDALAELRTVTAFVQRAAASTERQMERFAAQLAGSEASATSSPSLPPAPRSTAAPELNAHKYVGFEDRFRGSEEEIRARLTAYVPYFAGTADVLDVGCGRGEFLDLMRANGIPARGLDINGAMVEVCRARGLDAVQGDALSHLTNLEDATLGGLIAVQVVEHLDPDYLVRMLQTAFHKLRPGSAIVLETINPTCWVAFFESYIRDPTHVRPVHPETLQYLLLASGFNRVEIVYRSPVADKLQAASALAAPAQDEAARALNDLIAAFNRNVERLNARMFSYLDYATIGRRP